MVAQIFMCMWNFYFNYNNFCIKLDSLKEKKESWRELWWDEGRQKHIPSAEACDLTRDSMLETCPLVVLLLYEKQSKSSNLYRIRTYFNFYLPNNLINCDNFNFSFIFPIFLKCWKLFF